MIPEKLLNLINSQTDDIHRKNESLVTSQLQILGISEDSEFGEIYKKYKPANFESTVSYEPLCDIAEPSNQILIGTEFIHDTWEFPEKYICFTTLQSEGGYILDKESGQVWDFDLSDYDLFANGELAPRWSSFFDFLEWYLSTSDTH